MSIYKSKHSGPQIDKAVDDIIRINNTIVTDMDGTKYLSDDGTYKEIKVPEINPTDYVSNTEYEADKANTITRLEYESDMGDIDAALAAILEIQNSLIGGNS